MTSDRTGLSVATLVQDFFSQRLLAQRNASPQTIASYRDTFRLLLLFVQDHTLFAVAWDGKGPVGGELPVPVLDNLKASVGNQEDDDGSAQYCVDHLGNLLYDKQPSEEAKAHWQAACGLEPGSVQGIPVILERAK